MAEGEAPPERLPEALPLPPARLPVGEPLPEWVAEGDAEALPPPPLPPSPPPPPPPPLAVAHALSEPVGAAEPLLGNAV